MNIDEKNYERNTKRSIKFSLKNELREAFSIDDLKELNFTKNLMLDNGRIDEAQVKQLNRLLTSFYNQVDVIFQDENGNFFEMIDKNGMSTKEFLIEKINKVYDTFLENNDKSINHEEVLDIRKSGISKPILNIYFEITPDEKLKTISTLKNGDAGGERFLTPLTSFTNRIIDLREPSLLKSKFNRVSETNKVYSDKIEEICDKLIDNLAEKIKNNSSRLFTNLYNINDLSPKSAQSGLEYKGVNKLQLAERMGREKDFQSNEWFTMNQLKQRNKTIKKGAKASDIAFYADMSISNLSSYEKSYINDKISEFFDKNKDVNITNDMKENFLNEVMEEVKNDENIKIGNSFRPYLTIKLGLPHTPKLKEVTYKVFNGSDVVGYEPKIENKKELVDKDVEKTIRALEFSANKYLVPITRHIDSKSFFSYKFDENGNIKKDNSFIKIPNSKSFKSSKEELWVMLHEMAHSTKTELKRSFLSKDRKANEYDISDYAKEEMLAEFSVLFMSEKLGIDLKDLTEEHLLPYVKYYDDTDFTTVRENGLKILKENPKLFSKILNDAERASDLIYNKYTETLKNKDFIELENKLTNTNVENKVENNIEVEQNNKNLPRLVETREDFYRFVKGDGAIRAFTKEKLSDDDIKEICSKNDMKDVIEKIVEKTKPSSLIINSPEVGFKNITNVVNIVDYLVNKEILDFTLMNNYDTISLNKDKFRFFDENINFEDSISNNKLSPSRAGIHYEIVNPSPKLKLRFQEFSKIHEKMSDVINTKFKEMQDRKKENSEKDTVIIKK